MVQQYKHPGIYGIYINGHLVYIGKSTDMLWRLAEHYVGVKAQSSHKYRLIAEAKRRGFAVTYKPLYYAVNGTRLEIQEEIGQKESEYIRKYRPILNAQIPNEDEWKQYEFNHAAADLSAEEFIAAIS